MRFLLPVLLLASCSDPATQFPPPPGGQPPADAVGAIDGNGPATAPVLAGGPCHATEVARQLHPFEASKGITVSGRLISEETMQAQVLVDLASPLGGDAFQMVYHLICPPSDTFEAEIPPGLGELVFTAYLDEAGDGPSETDPAGTSEPVKVGSSDLEGVDIEIVRGTDMTRFLVAAMPPTPSSDDPPPPAVEGEMAAPPAEGAEAPLEAPPAAEPIDGADPVEAPVPAEAMP